MTGPLRPLLTALAPLVTALVAAVALVGGLLAPAPAAAAAARCAAVAGCVHRLRLRRPLRALAGRDGRVAPALAVLGRRGLPRRLDDVVPDRPGRPDLGAAAPRRDVGAAADLRGLAGAADLGGPAGLLLRVRRPDRPVPRGGVRRGRGAGRAEAAEAAERARALGIDRRSTALVRPRGLDLSGDDCRRSALRFLSGWTEALHDLGHRSGVYSNIAAGDPRPRQRRQRLARLLHDARPGLVRLGQRPRRTRAVSDKVRAGSWVGQRVHQYALDETATYGGVTLTIDRSHLRVGGGSAVRGPAGLRWRAPGPLRVPGAGQGPPWAGRPHRPVPAAEGGVLPRQGRRSLRRRRGPRGASLPAGDRLPGLRQGRPPHLDHAARPRRGTL